MAMPALALQVLIDFLKLMQQRKQEEINSVQSDLQAVVEDIGVVGGACLQCAPDVQC